MVIILLRMAFRAILHHTVRSLLTLLGIVIGIAGIITISAVGKGTQQKAREQFLAYGSKTIDIYQGNWMTPSKTNKPPKPITLNDRAIITSQCPAVQYTSPRLHQGKIQVNYEGQDTIADIMGTSENGALIWDRQIHRGLFFTQQHVERKDNVAVLSPEIAQAVFKLRDPVGAIILIKKVPFTVIGVLAPPKAKGKWDGLGSPELFIPFSTHQKYFGNTLHMLTLSTYTDEQVPEVTRQLEKIFRAAHLLEDDEPNDFMIGDNQTFAAAAEEASKSAGLFALIAALITLLVGGIGVMNIMLVAVQERTKEIGIKAALGATMNFIRMQFLIESVAICMIGGFLGITFGVAASLVLHHWMGVLAIIEPTPIIVSFFCTVLIGLTFGFYPAERAARLNPVEALTEY